VTEQKYYRRKKEYSGLRKDQRNASKSWRERTRLKRLVADANLDKSVFTDSEPDEMTPGD
jgi:hypothetical protein